MWHTSESGGGGKNTSLLGTRVRPASLEFLLCTSVPTVLKRHVRLALKLIWFSHLKKVLNLNWSSSLLKFASAERVFFFLNQLPLLPSCRWEVLWRIVLVPFSSLPPTSRGFNPDSHRPFHLRLCWRDRERERERERERALLFSACDKKKEGKPSKQQREFVSRSSKKKGGGVGRASHPGFFSGVATSWKVEILDCGPSWAPTVNEPKF